MIRDGRRSAATAEAVSVCVGHGLNDRSGVRRSSRFLSPDTDSENSFDSRHVPHHRKEVRISEQLLLDSHCRWRRVSTDPPSPADGRNDPSLTTLMLAGRRLERVNELRVHRRGTQETEDTCKESETPGLPEISTPPATPDTTLGPWVSERDFLVPDENVADPLLDACVLSVQRNSAGDRHREFRSTVSELVQPLWAGWPVSGPRTLRWCCKFVSEHALQPLAHIRELCNSVAHSLRTLLTFDQLQGAELSCFELLARR